MEKLNMNDDVLYDWVFKISKEFYELVYEDPWFKKIFRNIDQEIITTQQADFMTQNLGGPKKFCGRAPKDAHPQIWIDQNIWNYRQQLVMKAFQKVRPPQELIDRWIKVDLAFQHAVMNKGPVSECFGRYKTDEIIYEPMPDHLIKKAA